MLRFTLSSISVAVRSFCDRNSQFDAGESNREQPVLFGRRWPAPSVVNAPTESGPSDDGRLTARLLFAGQAVLLGMLSAHPRKSHRRLVAGVTQAGTSGILAGVGLA